MIVSAKQHRVDGHRWLIGLLVLLLPVLVQAQTVVGTVQFVHGEAMALGSDGEDRILTRGDEVHEGEVLVTGPDGAMQLQLSDGGLLALRADTELSIDEYQYAGEADDRSLFSLARGVFRKISGAIGQNEPDNVRMETPVATIGIRGTDFEGGFIPEGNGDPAGAYLRVNSGVAWLGNEGGELDLKPGQAGFVASSYQRPQLLEKTPGLFRVAMPTGPAEGEINGDNGPPKDGEAWRRQVRETRDELERVNRSDDDVPETVVFEDPEPGLTSIVAQQWESEFIETFGYTRVTPLETPLAGAGAINGSGAWGVVDEGTLANQAWIEVPVDGSIPGLAALVVTLADGSTQRVHWTATTASTGQGSEFFEGADFGFEVTWGRWSEVDYMVEDALRGPLPGLVNGELHYMYTDALTPLTTVASRTGQASFGYAGGTSVLMGGGEQLDVDGDAFNSTVQVNFDAGTLAYSLDINFAQMGANYVLNSGEADIGDFLSDGIALTGSCQSGTGCQGGLDANGVVGGNFAGPDAQALISFFRAMDAADRELWGTALFGEGFVMPN